MTTTREADSWQSFARTVWALQRRLPDAVPVGFEGPPAREAIRFRPVLDLDSPVAELAGVSRVDGPLHSYYEVQTNFFSLYGTASPLPASYTEDLFEESEDGLLRGFLDQFNHRLISLFYRAMVKYRHHVQFEWSGEDATSVCLRLLCGVTEAELPAATEVPGTEWLAHTSCLRRRTVSASTLLGVLRTRFSSTQIDLTQCVPEWLSIPEDQQMRLGITQSTLGEDACLGERVLDRSNTVRITVGPLTESEFMTFLPGGPRMQELREVLDFCIGTEIDDEIELVLAPDERPEPRLGSAQLRLGWSSWFESSESDEQSRISFLHRRWHHG